MTETKMQLEDCKLNQTRRVLPIHDLHSSSRFKPERCLYANGCSLKGWMTCVFDLSSIYPKKNWNQWREYAFKWKKPNGSTRTSSGLSTPTSPLSTFANFACLYFSIALYYPDFHLTITLRRFLSSWRTKPVFRYGVQLC